MNLFQPGVRVDKTGDALSKVGDPVTYTFTVTNTSSEDGPDLVLDSMDDTVLGDLEVQAMAADCGTLASGASCEFQVTRVVEAGDSDPLPNLVTVHYHGEGFSNEIADQASHSLRLVQVLPWKLARTGIGLMFALGFALILSSLGLRCLVVDRPA